MLLYAQHRDSERNVEIINCHTHLKMIYFMFVLLALPIVQYKSY